MDPKTKSVEILFAFAVDCALLGVCYAGCDRRGSLWSRPPALGLGFVVWWVCLSRELAARLECRAQGGPLRSLSLVVRMVR